MSNETTTHEGAAEQIEYVRSDLLRIQSSIEIAVRAMGDLAGRSADQEELARFVASLNDTMPQTAEELEQLNNRLDELAMNVRRLAKNEA